MSAETIPYFCSDCDSELSTASGIVHKPDGRVICGVCERKLQERKQEQAQADLFVQQERLFNSSRRNVEGFTDPNGQFHPIRASKDYNEFAAGDFEPRQRLTEKQEREQKEWERQELEQIRQDIDVPKKTLAQFVRKMGGIVPGGMFAGEIRRLGFKETGTTGLVNQHARQGSQKQSAEYVMDAANVEGYRDRYGERFTSIGDFLSAVEDSAVKGIDPHGKRGATVKQRRAKAMAKATAHNPTYNKQALIKKATWHLSHDGKRYSIHAAIHPLGEAEREVIVIADVDPGKAQKVISDHNLSLMVKRRKTNPVVTITESDRDTVRGSINAPYVGAEYSRLGGAGRESLLVVVSLDPRDSWRNGILENSRYARFHLGSDGVLEQFRNSGLSKFRKTRVTSVSEAIAKINKWVAGQAQHNPLEMFGPEAKAKARQVTKVRKVQDKQTKERGEIIGVLRGGWLKVKWDNSATPTLIQRDQVRTVRGRAMLNPQFVIRKTYLKGDPKFGRTTTLLRDGKPVLVLMGVVSKRDTLANYHRLVKEGKLRDPFGGEKLNPKASRAHVIAATKGALRGRGKLIGSVPGFWAASGSAKRTAELKGRLQRARTPVVGPKGKLPNPATDWDNVTEFNFTFAIPGGG